jgi:uncharacterized protein involved in exopolysaccharide biosynthesis
MDRPYPPDMPAGAYDPYEDEIELMDLLKVLWKWKYLIVAGTLFCAVAAAVVSLTMTKVWGVSMALQPGMVKVMDDGKTVYIDSPENIKTVIESGALNGAVLKDIRFPEGKEQPESVSFKVTVPKNTNAVEVVYETPHRDIGLHILKNLNQGLVERYARMVAYHREKFEMEIDQRSAQIMDERAILDATKREIQILDKTIDELEKEIRLVNENTPSLIQQREKFISNHEDTQNVLSAILFNNTIQQNMVLDQTSRDYLKQYRSERETLSLKLQMTQNKIRTLETEIKNIEFKKQNIQNIQVLKAPRSSGAPIKPKIRLNVLLAGVVGLFLTIFLSFFVEYISKYKRREAAEP